MKKAKREVSGARAAVNKKAKRQEAGPIPEELQQSSPLYLRLASILSEASLALLSRLPLRSPSLARYRTTIARRLGGKSLPASRRLQAAALRAFLNIRDTRHQLPLSPAQLAQQEFQRWLGAAARGAAVQVHFPKTESNRRKFAYAKSSKAHRAAQQQKGTT